MKLITAGKYVKVAAVHINIYILCETILINSWPRFEAHWLAGQTRLTDQRTGQTN